MSFFKYLDFFPFEVIFFLFILHLIIIVSIPQITLADFTFFIHIKFLDVCIFDFIIKNVIFR